MRYFLHLAYNGAGFCGWQRQPNAPSVQQTIEEAMALILRKHTPITGAGRTDTGVNAACMYAHFDVDNPIEKPESFLRSLNHICGKNIAFYGLIPVADDAHARFDATARTYKYYVIERKNPFSYPLTWLSPSHLNFPLMNEAAEILLHTEDFTSFAKLHTDVKTNICDVTEAHWDREGDGYVFTITANRFLRNMVRAVVGTLVEVGRGKISLDEFKRIIEAKDRCEAGTSMPPGALFLHNIRYPYI